MGNTRILKPYFLGKSRLLWTDLILTCLLIGGFLTIFVTGSVDAGGMSAVVQKAKNQDQFQGDSFSLDPTAQDSYISAFFGHFLLWFAIYAAFYSADENAKISGNICVAVMHTPFFLLFLAVLIMIGLALAVSPSNLISGAPSSPLVSNTNGLPSPGSPNSAATAGAGGCADPANFALRVTWPDQVLPNYVHEW